MVAQFFAQGLNLLVGREWIVGGHRNDYRQAHRRLGLWVSGHPRSRDTLEAKEFSQSVDRVSTISADKTRAVKLNIAKDKVTLSVVNPESGTATEDVGATYRASGMEIGFNARYLLDITGQIEGKEVRFLLSDAGSPAIIEDAEDARTLYVLMPLRV